MDRGVDDALEPGILRNQGNIAKSPRTQKRSAHGLDRSNLIAGAPDLRRDGALQSLVADELLARAGAALFSSVADDADEPLGKVQLRVDGEQETSGDRQLLV